MVFVDGENLTIRAQCVAEANNLALVEGRNHKRNVFYWLPSPVNTFDGTQIGDPLLPVNYWWLTDFRGAETLDSWAKRAYYYTSCPGDGMAVDEVRHALWGLKFHPEVFHKKRNEKTKAIDITLAKDLLSHAFLDNYDTCILVAGDRDYVPVVEEVKRIGKNVWLAFLDCPEGGLSEELRLASDYFTPLHDIILKGAKQPQTQPFSQSQDAAPVSQSTESRTEATEQQPPLS